MTTPAPNLSLSSGLSHLIGKTLTGYSTSNATHDTVEGLTLTFDDGSTIALANRYAEGLGWSAIYGEVRRGT